MNRIPTILVLWALGASSAHAVASARLTAGPPPGGVLRAGTTTTLRFTVDEKIDEMEVLLSLAGGRSFTLRVTREMPKGTHEITWRVPNLPTSRARLALRVGNEEEGEVIRDVSEEFTILASDTEPLEDVRPFQGEWRAGEALLEIPYTPPLPTPHLGGSSESIRAVRPAVDFDRASDAALTGAPPDRDPEWMAPARTDRVSAPTAPRFARNLPKRE